MHVRKIAMLVLAGALALSGCGGGAPGGDAGSGDGEDFPTKPIDLIVWSEAGGSGDTAMRVLAPLLEKKLGTSIVVRNIAGGGGVEAINHLLAQPADGHTLVAVSGTLAVLFGEEGVSFTPEDIQPVAQVETKPFSIYASKGSFSSLEGLVDEAKANPGTVNVTGVFPMGGYRLAWERFAQAAGIDAKWIPFDGTSEAIAAVAGNHAEAGVTYAGTIEPQVEAGKARILAVMSDESLENFPDTPTLKELGFDVTESGYTGVVTKSGVPDATLDKLAEAFQTVTKSSEWQQHLEKSNTFASTLTPEEYEQQLAEDAEFAAELKDRLGL